MAKTYICLGANGDIISILPILHREFITTGEKPRLIVAKDYARLLDGTSYIEPIIFEGHYSKLHDAQIKFGHLNPIPIQVYGSNWNRQTDSFVRDMWVRAGADPRECGQLPLVFDRRSPDNEQELMDKFIRSRPWVILCTSGNSSPFQYAAELSALIRDKTVGRALVIDVSTFVAPRFFDMLGFLEEAKVLVTIDSGLLHLSLATKIPTVALIVDRPDLWHGSPDYPNQMLRVCYGDFPWMKEDIMKAVNSWL